MAINTPVGSLDVGNTIGISDRSWTGMTTSQKINMFSKYKPVPYPSLFISNIPNWWKGYRPSYDVGYVNLCGIRIPTVSNLANTENLWEYDPPRGGINEPHRIVDFVNYQHNSIPPFKIGMSDILQLGVGKSFGCYMYYPDEPVENYDTTKALQITDLTEIDEYHLVLYLYNYTKKQLVGYKISEETILLNSEVSLYFTYEEMNPYIDDGDDIGAYVWLTGAFDNPTFNRISAKITSDTITNGRFTARNSLTLYRVNYQYNNIVLGTPNIYIADNNYYIGKTIKDDDDVPYTNLTKSLYITNWNFIGNTTVPQGYNVTWKLIAETAYPYNEDGDFVNPAIPRTIFYSSTHASSAALNINSNGLEYFFEKTANGLMSNNAIPVININSQVRLTVQCIMSSPVAFEKKVITSEIILNLSEL